jgi:hypothetical protein
MFTPAVVCIPVGAPEVAFPMLAVEYKPLVLHEEQSVELCESIWTSAMRCDRHSTIHSHDYIIPSQCGKSRGKSFGQWALILRNGCNMISSVQSEAKTLFILITRLLHFPLKPPSDFRNEHCSGSPFNVIF